MSTKIAWILSLPWVVLASMGCSTVDRREHDALKAYNDQLESENAKLRKYKEMAERMKDEMVVSDAESKLIEDLRVALLQALGGMKIDSGDVQYDPKTGKWTMAGDLLFDSGSFKITPKGDEVLKKFAETYRTKTVTLRIVGHTDRDPIAKAGTKQSLHFDHNVELGALRSCSVFMTLSKHGVVQSRMFVESWGNNNPVASNDTRPENKKKNRRVEIFILGASGTSQSGR